MRGNNFDFLRLALAVLVVRCHARLVGLDIPGTDDELFLGGRSCVECFFVISGYLIFKSWESSPRLAAYAEKRARRIVPAYLFVILASALGLSLLSTLPLGEYFADYRVYKYMAVHAVFLGFLQNTLPGTFVGHVQEYVNGPLWTIKIEVMFYAIVPLVAVLAHRINRIALFSAIYVTSIAWFLGFHEAAATYDRRMFEELAKQLPGQMSFFIAGGAIHYFHAEFNRHCHKLFPVSVVLLMGHFSMGLMPLYPAALAVAVIYLATRAPYLGNFGRFGDFSYGLYIYHYPILQILATVHAPEQPPWQIFTMGAMLALVASFLSWHLLEKPWLLKSSHYVQATREGAAQQSEQQRRKYFANAASPK
jgi:peptidoglycan/LPS O-acetylase OafA/YrhL